MGPSAGRAASGLCTAQRDGLSRPDTPGRGAGAGLEALPGHFPARRQAAPGRPAAPARKLGDLPGKPPAPRFVLRLDELARQFGDALGHELAVGSVLVVDRVCWAHIYSLPAIQPVMTVLSRVPGPTAY
jgi:hypothetical protein